jgi:DNA repair protein RadA/Sms
MALVSAQSQRPLDPEGVVFGEISLSGALRPVAQTDSRLKEAQKLGFTGAILPVLPKRAAGPGLSLHERPDLAAAVADHLRQDA